MCRLLWQQQHNTVLLGVRVGMGVGVGASSTVRVRNAIAFWWCSTQLVGVQSGRGARCAPGPSQRHWWHLWWWSQSPLLQHRQSMGLVSTDVRNVLASLAWVAARACEPLAADGMAHTRAARV